MQANNEWETQMLQSLKRISEMPKTSVEELAEITEALIDLNTEIIAHAARLAALVEQYESRLWI